MKDAPIIDMAGRREAKRDAELRDRFSVEPNDTALPIGFLLAQLMDSVRLARAERRNREARSS